MAKRSKANGNGHKKATLADVVAELRGVREDLRGLKEHVDLGLGHLGNRMERVEGVLIDARRDLRELAGELHEGFAELGQKIESAAVRDNHLEERVAKLEARLPEAR